MRLFGPNVKKMLEKQDVNGLRKASRDSEEEVRDAAVVALKKIGTPAIESGSLRICLNVIITVR